MNKIFSILLFFLIIVTSSHAQSDDEEYTESDELIIEEYTDTTANDVQEGDAQEYEVQQENEVQGPDKARIEASDNYLKEDVKKRDFDKTKWENLVKDLDYSDKEPEEKPKKEKEERKVTSPGISAPAPAALQYILIIIVVLALVFILFAIFGKDIFVKNQKVKGERSYSIDEISEYIHESDLERYLREAVQSGRWADAIRLYYLMVIKELSLKELIDWKKDKTNNTYLIEMHMHPQYGRFRELTYTYEKIWYGEIPVTQTDFPPLGEKYKSFIDQIRKGEGK